MLIKRDEFPTYHFACVVDDHLMNISTVIRGSEWLYSTPKHIRLFEYILFFINFNCVQQFPQVFRAFGWKYPKYLHLPLITRSKGRKLSKRVADAMVEYYTNQQGFIITKLHKLAVELFLFRLSTTCRPKFSG